MDIKVLGYKDLAAIPKEKIILDIIASSWSTSSTVPIPSWNTWNGSEAKILFSPNPRLPPP